MVLWELTVATAYFLGLKRTYKLALKIQRRLIGPNHPKIRHFVHRRTRAAFDMALTVHRNIQERDIEVGRNLGNRILRWLDRMKPSANIRGFPEEKPPARGNISTSTSKKQTSDHQTALRNFQRSSTRSSDKSSDKHLFSNARSTWTKHFLPISMMVQSANPARTTTQYRQLCMIGAEALRPNYGRQQFDGAIRQDILQWMRLSG